MTSLRGVFEVFAGQTATTAETIISLVVTFRLSFKTTEAQRLVKEIHNEFVKYLHLKEQQEENA
jgi:hypothetical protein